MLQLSERAKNVQGSVTLAIDSQAKQMRQQGVDVVSFGAGEPDFPTPQHICRAAIEAMEQGQTRYTPAAGTLVLRETICKKLKEHNGLTYTCLLYTSAGCRLYRLFLRAHFHIPVCLGDKNHA